MNLTVITRTDSAPDLGRLPGSIRMHPRANGIEFSFNNCALKDLIYALELIANHDPEAVIQDSTYRHEQEARRLLSIPGIRPADDLDDMIHDDFSAQASNLNNSGVESQVTHLLESGLDPRRIFEGPLP